MEDVRRPKALGRSALKESLTQKHQSLALSSDPFRPPEEVAASESTNELPTLPPPSLPEMPKSKKRLTRFIKWPKSRRARLITSLVIVALLGFGGWLISSSPKAQPPSRQVVVRRAQVIAKLVPSTLTGLPVAPSVNQRPVTAVMVENSLQARPQSGLSEAGVVFEALAEGGISRYMALFQDTAPSSIGPIRSARPYYVEWELGFDAGYAHVGGSNEAIADIAAWNVRDLNEFYNAGAYQRVSSRPAPHNVYSSIAALNQLEAAKGYTSSNYQGFVRQAGTPLKKPTVSHISLNLSGPDYNPSYVYNPTKNSYDRSEGGSAMIDAGKSQQVSPKVVIAMVVPYSLGGLDSSGAYYSVYQVNGSGPVYVFQDGGLTTGTWTKSGNTSQISFADANGQPIKLEPGQTWLTAVAQASNVSYSP